MTSITKKKQCRRRLAALTFLSNISLDGTHQDTSLGVLNFNFQCSKPLDGKSSRSANKQWVDAETTQSRYNKILMSRRRTISEGVEKRDAERMTRWSGTEDKIVSSCANFDRQSRNKDRVHKFMTDTKARLSNLSQKRKQLIHQKSIRESYGFPPYTSTENLASNASRSSTSSVSPSESLCPSVLDIRLAKSVYEQQVPSERLIMVSSKKVPFAVFSSLPYRRSSLHGTSRSESIKQEATRRRHTSSMRQLSIISDGPDPFDLLGLLGIEKPEDGQDISYVQLLAPTQLPRRCRSYAPELEHPPNNPHHLHPSGCLSFDQAITVRTHSSLLSSIPTPSPDKVILERENGASSCHHPCHVNRPLYNPNLLDDPELIAGKHSTLLAFPSYITSVIDYVKPTDLKRDLNDKFKERFPHIQLTLSKLRSLKKEMCKIAKLECNIDFLVVAQAYVYFEKLILKMLVNKQNRKLCAGACLLLSAKLNDVKGTDLRNLIERIESVFRVYRKDLLCVEFGALVALEFSLHLPTWEILSHYQRLMYES